MFFNQVITRHDPDILGANMNHISIKAGLKRWGKKVIDAIHREMNQLHMRDTFLLLQCKNMSHEHKKHKLEYHIFLKENRNGTIKLITVAGVKKQRCLSPKKMQSFPSFPHNQYY